MKATGQKTAANAKGVIEATADSHQAAGNIGAVGGGLAGAALGAAIGPLGAVTGAVLGATFGAIAAKGIAEGIDPDSERKYWEGQFHKEPYHDTRYGFPDYDPAYQMALRHYHPQTSFEAVEKDMSDEWAEGRGSSKLEWHEARHAAKAGWDRVHSSPSRV
jgi:hypothetical protein